MKLARNCRWASWDIAEAKRSSRKHHSRITSYLKRESNRTARHEQKQELRAELDGLWFDLLILRYRRVTPQEEAEISAALWFKYHEVVVYQGGKTFISYGSRAYVQGYSWEGAVEL